MQTKTYIQNRHELLKLLGPKQNVGAPILIAVRQISASQAREDFHVIPWDQLRTSSLHWHLLSRHAHLGTRAKDTTLVWALSSLAL